MKLPGRWLVSLLALASVPAAAEELSCEFGGGSADAAALDAAARRWEWAPSAAARTPGSPPGTPFWFMRARLPDGGGEGSVAGSETPPARDYWAAAVHRRPSVLVLIELGSDAARVLTVSTIADAEGRRPAAYARHVGGPSALRVEQLTGTCRSEPPAR